MALIDNFLPFPWMCKNFKNPPFSVHFTQALLQPLPTANSVKLSQMYSRMQKISMRKKGINSNGRAKAASFIARKDRPFVWKARSIPRKTKQRAGIWTMPMLMTD